MKEKFSREIADFRDYRPAAIALIDLVKHSKRSTDEVHVIQRILEDILCRVSELSTEKCG